MARVASLKWDSQRVIEAAKKAISMHDLAQGVADRAANVAVDTGFMKNSFYIITADGINTYNQTWPSGEYINQEGDEVKREKAPAADLGEYQALIGNAAPYAILHEIENSFLYTSLEAARDRLPHAVKPF